MVKDFTAFWLDTRTTGKQVGTSTARNEQKAFCMVGLGQRWNDDTWPATDRFYEAGICR